MKGSFSAVLIVLCLCLSANAADRRPSGVHEVSKGSRPAVTSDGNGRLYAVFEAYDSGKKTPDVFCSTSIDFGATWSPRQNISRMQSASEHPAVAVEKNGAVDVVWTSNGSGLKNPDIFL